MSVTKTYQLENLCCPNCAAAIEREVSGLQGVENVKVDFESTKITLNYNGTDNDLLNTIAKIAVEIDEDIVTKEV